MKHIVYTQRVDLIKDYGERRDAADQNIPEFLSACGYLPFPIMNIPSMVNDFCNAVSVEGIFLTGGNDLSAYGGNALERDNTEKFLMEYAIQNDIPLFGICRGMQFILHFFGSEMEKIRNHIKKEHAIHGRICRTAVNSYHGMGAQTVHAPLEILSKTDDGVVEAVQHSKYKIAGIMWHPERCNVFLEEDIFMIKNFFEKGRLV